MNNVMVLLMKFIANVIIFTIALDLFFDATIIDILSFSLIVTLFSYILGDRIILPRVGNANATVIDFTLTYLLVWIFGSILLHSYIQIAWGSIIAASLVAVSEVFVHRILLNRNPEANQNAEKSYSNGRLAYGMETAEEFDPNNKDNN